MWAGAGLSMVGVILTVAVGSAVRSGILDALIRNTASAAGRGSRIYTQGQLHQWAHGIVVAFIVGEVTIVLLWAWMAWANYEGRGWARITASVFFALITVEVLRSLRWTSVSFLFMALEWVIGMVAVMMLWRRETTQYIGAG